MVGVSYFTFAFPDPELELELELKLAVQCDGELYGAIICLASSVMV